MSLIVQKFGGSSVADAQKIFNVANIIAKTYKEGNDVVVVVSAQGDTTDELIEKAQEINPKASKREMDMLLASGEQISIALLSMALEKLGLPVISLLGWQAGVKTNSRYGNARIKSIDTERIRQELDKHNIVVVAGFQGINKYDDITTLGRGGSDTSAVALAAALNGKCQIYTDVDGVYTADPRKVPNAKKIEEITYDEMLELATLGAQVLHNRSVELAKKYSVELEVLSSMKPDIKGTIVKEAISMEKMLVKGVAMDANVARISVIGVKDQPGVAFKIFSLLAKNNINVDIILQSTGWDNTKDISFTVAQSNAEDCVKLLKDNKELLGAEDVVCDENIAKVSIVGAGMETHAGVAAKMFESLYDANINIQMISTSEIKISVLIDRADADKAVSAVHNAFFE